jgi:hypothetical protein
MKRTAAFMLLVLALLALPIMAWAGAAKSDYNWQKTGHLMFFDGATYETHFGTFPIAWGDDMAGLSATSNSTTFTGTLWAAVLTEHAKMARLAADPGYWELDTSTTGGAQNALLYWGNEKRVYPDMGAVYEVRVKMPALTTAVNGTGAWWGLGGAWASGSVTDSAFVGFTYNSTDGLKFRNWNSTDQLNSTVSAASLTADTWAIFRTDFTDLSNVRAFVNGVEVTDGAQSWSYTGDLQPTLYVNATTTGSSAKLDVDYVRFWQNRE